MCIGPLYEVLPRVNQAVSAQSKSGCICPELGCDDQSYTTYVVFNAKGGGGGVATIKYE